MPEPTPPLPRCPVCCYDLTGLPRDHRCPECGFEYDDEMRVWQCTWRRWSRRYGLPAWGVVVGGMCLATIVLQWAAPSASNIVYVFFYVMIPVALKIIVIKRNPWIIVSCRGLAFRPWIGRAKCFRFDELELKSRTPLAIAMREGQQETVSAPVSWMAQVEQEEYKSLILDRLTSSQGVGVLRRS